MSQRDQDLTVSRELSPAAGVKSSGGGSAHTLGPWKALSDRVISQATYDTVCATHPSGADMIGTIQNAGQETANAHLIAAAPELLAALRAMLRATDFGDSEPWVVQANAAIAKALPSQPHDPQVPGEGSRDDPKAKA